MDAMDDRMINKRTEEKWSKERTETRDGTSENTQYGSFCVRHLALDRKLSLHVYLSDPKTKCGNEDRWKEEDRSVDQDGSKPDDHG